MTAVAISLSNNEQFMAWVLYDGGNPLEVMPFDVLVSVAMCAVLRVWGNVSDAGADCGDGTESAILRYVQTPAQIDQIGGVPGLSQAMESVGWLRWSDDDSHAVFPGFLKHNTLKPSDIGAADRMRRWRASKKVVQPARNGDRNAPVTQTVTQAQPDRNATRNCSSESVSVSVSSSSFAQAKEGASPSPSEFAKVGRKARAQGPGTNIPPTLDECITYGATIGMDAQAAEYCWQWWESAGWRRKGGPVKNWQRTMDVWAKSPFGNAVNNRNSGNGEKPKPQWLLDRLAAEEVNDDHQ